MIRIFKLKNEERWIALTAFVVIATLLGLMIYQYSPLFLKGGALGYWSIFSRNFRMSGYDCWSYITLSNLRIHFETMRHPLFLSLLLPLFQINQWLMDATGVNFAVFLMGALTTFCAVYALIFLYRTMKDVIGLSSIDALLLTLLFFSLAHAMVVMIVPDHFVLSLFLLTLTLYVAGMKCKRGETFTLWQSALLLFLTAGVTVTNGAKTLLAALFINGRRVPTIKFIFIGALLPLALLFAIQHFQYKVYEIPQQTTVRQITEAKQKKDSVGVARHQSQRKQWETEHTGRPISNLPLLKMTDVTTPRVPSIIENLFGESIQLHCDHPLEDMAFTRPVFVTYRSIHNYIIEFTLLALLFIGLLCGRRSSLLQMCASWFAIDFTLHIILGFGINEVYIMSADWIFIFPVGMAYLVRILNPEPRLIFRFVTASLTLYLLAWNGSLLITHLLTPYRLLVR